ncbi:MAG: spore coat associated protein CotJA [Lachnospiraceae bacterium]|nr:spore coat associated protein CotJA [Lachnospiraceae bacterium]
MYKVFENEEVTVLESCKPYGRNPYGRNMNQCVNHPHHGQMRTSDNCNSCQTVNHMPISNNSDCGCNDNNMKMRTMPLAMAYVPIQNWGELYDPETALCQGTIFPDLNLKFCGARGKM